MWKNVALVGIFLTLAPIALATSIFTLFTVSSNNYSAQVLAASQDNLAQLPSLTPSVESARIYASSNSNTPSVGISVTSDDARVYIIRDYLDRYNSPMEPYAGYLVEMADKYDLDFRLLTAIAQQESNLCKKIPDNTYNCWGWGIHSQGTLGFNSYKEGIEIVSRGLKTSYKDKGYVTVDEIMDKWVPHSPERAWAQGVTAFMEEME